MSEITIGGLDIQILTDRENRTVFMDVDITPYYMRWNMAFKRWDFISIDIPDELRKIENDISEFIENSNYHYELI
jgi:hypothetical protein